MRQARNGRLHNKLSHIGYILIYRIYAEYELHILRERSDIIEKRREIGKQHRKYLIKILDILEKYEKSRQNIAHTDVEYNKADYRVQHHKKMRTEAYAAGYHKYEVNYQREQEIEGRGGV